MEDSRLSHQHWPRETILFRLARVVTRVLLRVLFLFRVEGLEQYPRGAAVIVANHPSALDPLFIAAALPERILFIGAREFLTMPVVGWAMRAYGCIPVRRGQVDASAVRDALRALAAGYKVGVFPEGQISPELSAGRRGGALLAARGGVPLLPVAVVGSGQVFPLGARMVRPGRVTVYIGPPLPPPGGDRADQDAATESAMAWITGALARARHFV
jgi:1-acyl-sn-glycerol-3-phosphate acyltransferase